MLFIAVRLLGTPSPGWVQIQLMLMGIQWLFGGTYPLPS